MDRRNRHILRGSGSSGTERLRRIRDRQRHQQEQQDEPHEQPQQNEEAEVHNNNNNNNNFRPNRQAPSTHKRFGSGSNSSLFQLLKRFRKLRKVDGTTPRKVEPYVFRPWTCESVPCNSQGSSKIPFPRSGHRIVVDDYYIYVFGGFNANILESNVDQDQYSRTKPLFKELWRFSKFTQTWEYLPCTGMVPNSLVSSSLVMCSDHQLLAFGGSGFPFGHRNSNEIRICDLRDRNWVGLLYVIDDTDEADGLEQQPTPGYGQALAFDREKNSLYVCGGTDGQNYNCNMHRFDLDTQKWQLLSITPQPDFGRYRHEMALYLGALYLVGGGTSDALCGLEQIDKFDIATCEWSKVQTKPCPSRLRKNRGFPNGRMSHDCVQRKNIIYMIGGRSLTQDFDEVWSLNLDTFQWTEHPNMRLALPTSFIAADSTADGQLSIFGGVVYSLDSNQARRLDTVQQIWIDVPSLKRLALNAVIHTVQQTGEYERSKAPIKLLRAYFDKHNLSNRHITLPLH